MSEDTVGVSSNIAVKTASCCSRMYSRTTHGHIMSVNVVTSERRKTFINRLIFSDCCSFLHVFIQFVIRFVLFVLHFVLYFSLISIYVIVLSLSRV